MSPGTCIHFRGLRGTAHDCALGLDIRKITGGPQLGIALRIPCRAITMGRKPEELPARATCEKYQEPTAEEIAEFEQALMIHSRNTTKARDAIIEHAKTTRGFVQGKMPCPICAGGVSGSLHYRIQTNGHVHAQCTTKGCVNFIE